MEVELATTLVVLGVIGVADKVDVDVDVVFVGVVTDTLAGIELEVIEDEIEIKVELDVDVETVLGRVLSVSVSDGVLELKNPSK